MGRKSLVRRLEHPGDGHSSGGRCSFATGPPGEGGGAGRWRGSTPGVAAGAVPGPTRPWRGSTDGRKGLPWQFRQMAVPKLFVPSPPGPSMIRCGEGVSFRDAWGSVSVTFYNRLVWDEPSLALHPSLSRCSSHRVGEIPAFLSSARVSSWLNGPPTERRRSRGRAPATPGINRNTVRKDRQAGASGAGAFVFYG